MKRVLSSALAALFVTFTPPSEASEESQNIEPIEIIGAHLEGRLDGFEGSGYNRLIRELGWTTTPGLAFHRYPLPRAIRNFNEKPRACLFPTSAGAISLFTDVDPKDTLESIPIDTVSAHLLSRREEQVIRSVEEIEGKTLVAQAGVPVGLVLPASLEYELVPSPNDHSSLRMLNAGRVDVLYSFIPDVYIIAERYGIELPGFDPLLRVFETKTHLVCKNVPGVEGLIDAVDKQLVTLKKSGQLQELLGKYAQIVYE